MNISPAIEQIDASGHPEFDGHEDVWEITEPSIGFHAFIAVHRRFFHPYLGMPTSLGGWRKKHYQNPDEALADVLRLSNAMSSKAAFAAVNFGGAKAVMIAPRENRDAPVSAETYALLMACARVLNSLNGQYFSAADVGFYAHYVHLLSGFTKWVAGRSAEVGGSGNPSPYTARGVIEAIHCTISEIFNDNYLPLQKYIIAIQGIGGVGMPIAKYFCKKGARVYIADTDPAELKRAHQELGASAQIVAPDLIHTIPCHVFIPCATGGILNERTIPELNCLAVCGGANNQLATPEDGDRLHERGTLWVPDFVANAMGLKRVVSEFEPEGPSDRQFEKDLRLIPENLKRIFRESRRNGIATNRIADEIARKIIADRISGRELW